MLFPLKFGLCLLLAYVFQHQFALLLVLIVKPHHVEHHDIPKGVKFAHFAEGLSIFDYSRNSKVEAAINHVPLVVLNEAQNILAQQVLTVYF